MHSSQNAGGGAANANAQLIKDSSTETFVTDVIDASREVPVIVDFWAPWCGPCKQLGPALEKVVTEAGGAVRMVKVNVDENQQLAQQMGVQSIPAVFAFKDGQPVDGFMGAQPESQLKEFVEKLGGAAPSSPSDDQLQLAQEALAAGDIKVAAQSFIMVLQQNNQNVEALGGLATVYLEMDDLEQAKQTLAMVPDDEKNNAAIKAVQARIDLMEKAADLDDIGALAAKLEQNPDDLQARFDLAIALNAAGDREDAIHHLVEIVRINGEWNESAARLQLLQLFEVWGPTDPMTILGRQRLSTVLFS